MTARSFFIGIILEGKNTNCSSKFFRLENENRRIYFYYLKNFVF